MQHSQREEAKMRKTTLYRRIRSGLTILCILLLAIVLVTPGVLQLLYRADSKVALGHAKSVRMAMQAAGAEEYGRGSAFSDVSGQGGVAEGVYEEILLLSKAPGDFWILQMDPDGYRVREFLYQENEYTVWYDADAEKTYRVYHNSDMIDTGE